MNYMDLAINESLKGIGKVNPNPLVGAVIVKNNKILSTGYHEFFGGRHAEVVAIDNAKEKGYSIKNSEMYVTLEPCSHYGKTPPCADRIIKEGIKKVYVGLKDPNPLVGGKGIKKLKDAGIYVEVGLMKEKIKGINRVFLTYIVQKRPYVHLKLALTLDGFIANKDGNSKWISNESSRKIVHEMRNFYSSILVGAGTILKDNPSLNVRLTKKIRNPLKIILDKHGLTANKNLNIYNEGENIIFTSSNEKWNFKNTEIIYTDKLNIKDILKELYNRHIDSVLVEGGSKVASEFIEYADRISLFYSSKIFGRGISPFENLKNEKNLKTLSIKNIDNNILWELENVYWNS
ncbi:riboflavin biosynthesis protein RibD [Tepiditoga spiralis]|uniref:Riboflavin biosynthesis protein RibD n=1 Tax=Tepiditoga spiralis TaxID=2108365 RepID=A0A7G1G4Q6_9BACT|nr:bifunctional diaminohydroxyphosphoribosylaminopyrimidine deaminase/5-amino-6-(5-phosphoribosylamino)uracil reductase RibD [Tepiditoga spiralis]BBE31518.1 riboflavin biosynthesis protein RibD [Tepiditoga spiralis]